MFLFKPFYSIFLFPLFLGNISANYTDLNGNYLCQNDQSNLNLTVKLALKVDDEERVAYAMEWTEKANALTPLMESMAFICSEDKPTIAMLLNTRGNVRGNGKERNILKSGELVFLDKTTECLTSNKKTSLIILREGGSNTPNHLYCTKLVPHS